MYNNFFLEISERRKADEIQNSYFEPRTATEVKEAIHLVKLKYLTKVKYLRIENIDLSEVSDDDLAEPIKIVTESVSINNARVNTSVIFTNMKCCIELEIENMTLTQDQTRHIVTAMESNVDVLVLHRGVYLPVAELTKYSGAGRCGYIRLRGDTSKEYHEPLAWWAFKINWFKELDVSGTGANVNGWLSTFERTDLFYQSN